MAAPGCPPTGSPTAVTRRRATWTWPSSCSTRSTCSRTRPTGWPRPGVVARRAARSSATRSSPPPSGATTCPVLQSSSARRSATVFECDAGRRRRGGCSTRRCSTAGAVVQLRPGRAGRDRHRSGGDLAARLLAAVAAPRGRARRGPAGHLRTATRAAARTSTAPAAGTRRYCCSLCNDRAAARAYRRRAGPRPDPDAARQPRTRSRASSRRALPPTPRPAPSLCWPRSCLAVTLTPVTAAAADQPVLGSPSHLAPAGKGWGKAAPAARLQRRRPLRRGRPARVAALGRAHRHRPRRDLAAAPRGRLLRPARPDRAPRRGARRLRGRHRGVHPARVPRRAPTRRPGRQALASLGGRRRHLLTPRRASNPMPAGRSGLTPGARALHRRETGSLRSHAHIASEWRSRDLEHVPVLCQSAAAWTCRS